MNHLGLCVGGLCYMGRDALRETVYYLELLLRGVHKRDPSVWFALPVVQQNIDRAAIDASGFYAKAEMLGCYLPLKGEA